MAILFWRQRIPSATAAVAPPKPGLASLETLRIPAFRYLWGSAGLTHLANQMRMMIVAWLVLDMTNSQMWVGLVNGLPAFAIAGLGLAGGVLVDRASPKRALLQARVTMAVAAFLTAFLVTTGAANVWHLLLLTLLASGVNGLDVVAAQISLNSLVSRERLLNALSLTRVGNNVAQIVGPPLGGVLMAWAGAPAALWVLAAAFALALAALSKFPNLPPPPRKPASALQDLREGFRYVGRTPHVLWLLILGGLAVLAACFFPLLPAYTRDTLQAGPDALGYLLGSFGAGGLLGSLALALRADVSRKGFAVTWSAIVWSLALVTLALSRELILSAACMFLIGVMWSVWMTNLNALLQTKVEREMQGRVISINKIVSQGGMAWLVGGLLGAALGQTATFFLGAIVFIALHLVAYWRISELREAD